MAKKKKVERPAPRVHNKGFAPMKNGKQLEDTLCPDLVVDETQVPNTPERIKAFWSRYSLGIKGRLKKVEKGQSESIRWARETLIR
jgi:hypothetical protein